MSQVEEKLKRYFTDFDGKFDAQLSDVTVSRLETDEQFGTSSPYACKIKAQYNRDLLRLLDDGMLLAVKNFRSDGQRERYTLLEAVRFWPEHFGLRGVRDYQYFPMQFEVIQQSVEDWETNDKTTMMIQLATIPINYDLVLEGDKEPDVERGFSYPIPGSRAYILNKQMIRSMYNRGVPEATTCIGQETCADARKDPRLGTIKMFEAADEDIPIYIDYDLLVRYHFGIFAFTGGGKSNLLSNMLRRILIHKKDTKIVIFDISCEYPFLLMDIFADPSISSKIILENEVEDAEEFYNSVVKPKEYETDKRVVECMAKILSLGRVSSLRRERMHVPLFSEFLSDITKMKEENARNPNYVEALSDIEDLTLGYMQDKNLREDDELTQEFVENLIDVSEDTAENYKVHGMSALRGWFASREMMRKYFDKKPKATKEGYDLDGIEKLLENDAQLVCLSISEPTIIKRLVISLSSDLLLKRKRDFRVRPYILFVWDEAQEFVASPANVTGIDKTCSQEVERLLRQGRKYGLGGCIATQRIANLNTNALQQLHTYFVSTMPRPYDRGLVSNTFMIDKTILEKTLEFVPGEWLLSSYLATGMANVPIFIKADNAEKEVSAFIEKT
ncbi:ATP-binding protein [Candidatus Bathyarchaeota archaeon]|nr:ATP-binding protein [Candidatus Bathyarchaeota archaeon]